MVSLVVTIFLLGAASAIALNRRRLASTLGITSLVLAAFVGCGLLPDLLLRRLQVREPLRDPAWSSNNYIVVLGGGVERWPERGGLGSSLFQSSRVREAARLYRDCKKHSRSCVVLASGGDPQKQGISEARVMRRELMDLGVEPGDLLLEERSKNTYQNAEFSAGILRSAGPSAAAPILVTSGAHLSRALLYFGGFALPAVGAPSDQVEARLSLIPLSINFFLADLAWHEFSGIARFHLYEFMGWNRRVTAPGAL